MPKSDLAEPKLSGLAFQQRCKTLAVAFAEALGQPTGQVAFAPVITSTRAQMAVAGMVSEHISRNRGAPHSVVPLCQLSDDIFAWTGYRELWEKQGGEQSFRFVEGGFTLHIGRQGELAKPQILRSEWVGQRSSGFNNKAGHPHWQLDVLETARSRVGEPDASFGAGDELEVSAEFSSIPSPPSEENMLLGLTVERMHLASAALWWRKPQVPLAHPPLSTDELDRWVLGCVAYLRQEVARCSILVPPY